MIEYNFGLSYFIFAQNHQYLSREVLNITTPVLNDELNSNFELYRVDINNGR